MSLYGARTNTETAVRTTRTLKYQPQKPSYHAPASIGSRTLCDGIIGDHQNILVPLH